MWCGSGRQHAHVNGDRGVVADRLENVPHQSAGEAPADQAQTRKPAGSPAPGTDYVDIDSRWTRASRASPNRPSPVVAEREADRLAEGDRDVLNRAAGTSISVSPEARTLRSTSACLAKVLVGGRRGRGLDVGDAPRLIDKSMLDSLVSRCIRATRFAVLMSQPRAGLRGSSAMACRNDVVSASVPAVVDRRMPTSRINTPCSSKAVKVALGSSTPPKSTKFVAEGLGV